MEEFIRTNALEEVTRCRAFAQRFVDWFAERSSRTGSYTIRTQYPDAERSQGRTEQRRVGFEEGLGDAAEPLSQHSATRRGLVQETNLRFYSLFLAFLFPLARE